MKSFILCAGLFFLCVNGFAQKNEKAASLEAAARALSVQIAEQPQNLPELFDRSIFRYLSLEKLSDILAGIYTNLILRIFGIYLIK